MLHYIARPLAACLLGLLLSAATLAGTVNINTADAATLARELKGVGLKKAQAIVDYRTKYGPFKSPDELALVKGIGPKAIEANRADIRLDARSAVPAPATKGPSRPNAATPESNRTAPAAR